MLSWLRDTVLRLLPHATKSGLRALGRPDRSAPVLVTGNYTTTVRRLLRVLSGRDIWLLVCNSRGINVWCAATGGHFTNTDVIAAIRTSGLLDQVEHRTLIMPQLAATGIEPRRIEHATGFRSKWGPARLEDLPTYLDRGCRTTRALREIRFPLWERLEMAVMWAAPMGIVGFLAAWLFAGIRVGILVAAIAILQVIAVFALLPLLPIVGTKKWLTFGSTALLGGALGLLCVSLFGALTSASILTVLGSALAFMLVLSVDIAGTTPLYPGSINSIGNRFHIELVEDRCTGDATCVLVCPRNVVSLDGKRRKAVVKHPENCVGCGACIVQCPEDALRFRFEDGRVIEPRTVRTTRVNLVGRRSRSRTQHIDDIHPRS